jgi:uncharacterized membrane protein YkgB
MKFTAYEAAGIAPLALHSPFMDWLYLFLGERNFSDLLGIVEITLGLGIALRQLVPLVSGFASLLCVGVVPHNAETAANASPAVKTAAPRSTMSFSKN